MAAATLPIGVPHYAAKTGYALVLSVILLSAVPLLTNGVVYIETLIVPLTQNTALLYATITIATATALVIIHIKALLLLRTKRAVVLPATRMAGGGVSYTMETVAAFVIGVLVVGIILGVFVLLSNMSFEFNGTRYTLIPGQIASLTQSTTLTLLSIIIVVAIVLILIPVVRYLMDLFAKGGGGR
jgi:hypothetical protein